MEKISLLETLVYHLPAVVFLHDLRTNRHIWTNNNYQYLIGYTDEEIRQIGTEEARELFHPGDMQIILAGTELLRSGQAESFSGIYRIRHKMGHWVWMYCNATVVQREKDGTSSLALGFAVDFSPHIQSDQRLNELISENRRLINCIRLNSLTQREKEIVSLVARGQSCKEISNALKISYYTTETHIKHIHHKLGLYTLPALLKFALESGLNG
jgi:PAS domain S-box-containing protein